MRRGLFAWICLTSLVSRAWALPADLDATFGTLGIAASPVPDSGYSESSTAPGGVAVQADGKVVTASAATGFRLVRYLPNGAVDTSFGNAGVAVVPSPVGSATINAVTAIEILASGAIVVAGFTLISPVDSVFVVARFTSSGALDKTFGNDGVALTMPRGQPAVASALRVQPDGKLVAAGATSYMIRPRGQHSVLVRYHADGSLDSTFGVDGAVLNGFEESRYTGGAAAALLQPDGKIVTAGSGPLPNGRTTFSLWRYKSDGSVDAAFGSQGNVLTAFELAPTSFGDANATNVALQGDRIVVAGVIYESLVSESQFSRSTLALARYRNDGTLDPSFGTGGKVVLTLNTFNTQPQDVSSALAVQPDGKLLVGTSRYNGVDTDYVLIRYHRDGALDETFGVAGVAAQPAHAGHISELALQPDGKVVAAGKLQKAALVRYVTDENPLAVEYHHAQFDHYFVTSNVHEIQRLDGGQPAGWARTGLGFRVYEIGSGHQPVCRFFSGGSFEARSSHFYTAFADECEAVKNSAGWIFEGNVFELQASHSLDGCPPGTAPLYRLYNNGRGGAPNHRYVTDLATRATMFLQGWIAEGSGIGVAGCVPLAAN